MADKKIMLVCAAGMSTSLMVTRMEKAAAADGLDFDIYAFPAAEADEQISQKKPDVLLLGPQVSFMKGDFESKLADQDIPVDVIDMQAYGTMNGEKVLQQALTLTDDK